MLVRERMTREVLTASPEMTLADALAITREHGIRHLPVTAEGRLVGVVTDRDLRMALPPPWAGQRDEQRRELGERTVAELMVPEEETITVPPTMLVEDAARIFYQNKVGCLPVLEEGRVVGILTATDLLRTFVDLLMAHGRSSRIEVRMPNRPGELARVVRLIGVDHRINITGMTMPPTQESGKATMVIHLQTVQPHGVIEALTKMGYEVGWPTLAS